MAVLAGNLTSVGNPLGWSLLFARQPEPDLEFTEEELDQTTATRTISPMKPGKKSGGGRPLLWILLLVLVGGIIYIAMEPDQLADLLAPIMGESMPPEPPPAARAPQPATPIPPPAPPQPAAGSTVPAQLAPSASGTVPTAPGASMPPQASTPFVPEPPAPVASIVPTPLFAEGQKVTVVGDPTVTAEMIPLWIDASGTKPGPVVRPGVTLTVLDGDLQASGWVYSVRTDEGTRGWISEKRLRLKF